MNKNSQAGFFDYLPLMLMTISVFTAASLVFIFILKMSAPVPVFIFFAIVQVLCMLLYYVLPAAGKPVARKISMILIGSTILFLAGLLGKQNFQVEGLVFLILGGIFGGPVIHFIMKIAGTLFTGRSWCSWGCWTAAVLDFLPYKNETVWKNKTLPKFRYFHLILSIIAVTVLYKIFGYNTNDIPAVNAREGQGNLQIVYWFITGNLLYYFTGIALAFRMKDNRAFCKYLCPVAVPLKLSAFVSFLRIKRNDSNCSACLKCERQCPSSIKIYSYIEKNERVTSTECIMCLSCVAVCPEGKLKTSLGIDFTKSEKLNGI